MQAVCEHYSITNSADPLRTVAQNVRLARWYSNQYVNALRGARATIVSRGILAARHRDKTNMQYIQDYKNVYSIRMYIVFNTLPRFFFFNFTIV